MSMKDWAKREVELACRRENPNRKEGEFDYGCSCYGSALKAFNSLCEDAHSGTSIYFTKAILNRLIDGKVLTPIEDTDDIWNHVFDRDDGAKVYQCRRMSSFFKYVYPDGAVTYSDNNRDIGFDIGSSFGYLNGHIRNIVNEMFPIKMPYMPEEKPFKVYTETFLVDPKNGDFDTRGILYLIKPDGERVDINRYFKEGEEPDPDWIEIDKGEYEKRKITAEKLSKERESNL